MGSKNRVIFGLSTALKMVLWLGKPWMFSVQRY